ncbi:NADH dehydrogenase [Mycobacterium sp. 1482292.6]|uniref:NAD(P)/FAD-dependent oxidoreductase n=1 Tax=unclassified Mycobacterium TaxID=2642494 RepID=UPI0007FFB0D3|nr:MULTISPECIES: FAD-dependent oxidoreductase [unclassified Mycobacterium]OBJ12670.1 NADH dehydrogenase [Mycobacterium sp. 1482292.6]OBJ22726.1 NADH dehydrogenase [Mycobacterium sp. 1245801.1]
MTPALQNTKTSIVIVGSGFVGFGCARRLARRLRKLKGANIELTVVSAVDYMLYTPLLADVVGGLADARAAMIPLAGMLDGVRQIRGHVDGVDFEERTICYTDLEQRRCALSWDRLVLAPGSVSRLFDIPGLATYARGFKTTAEVLYLRDHLLEQLELANLEHDPNAAQARRTIVVVGASATGTVLATTVRAVADAAAHQLGFDPAEVKILLLDIAKKVMPELGDKLSAAATQVLESRGIELRLGTTLKEVDADHVVLSDGARVGAHTVVWVAGVTAAPLIQQLGLPTERGRLTVQADLEVPGHSDVFAAGDAAAVPDLTQPGNIAAPTAQHATRQAKVLADNVLASLGYGTKKNYEHHDMGMVSDLGPGQAVANPFNIHLTGRPAKLITRVQRLSSIPRNFNRLQAAFAYTAGAAFPRTLVSLGLSSQNNAEFSTSEGIPLPKPS